ncbi:cytochrome P450 [Nonomuraea sp. NEAU-A123]|uniref:cytochrome P450 n=1 Tax=Nonomuraea sp. NEAU-A123 TaxID=2839649 RepID=UPI001BE465D6|nr:cytochrome P450 [Nonomuraea sp. NEAU-A123]MBT2230017.1 cytochrome P450 [Nonomuraea sp. NEAU-A123]MBT2230714.1 cytochrome P450 [Nonomuraea sp. NEAU-A123]
MTSTLNPAEIPEYPMARAKGCPFDPPPALQAKQAEGPLSKVRLWDGSTPWVVTRYAEQRALLADPRVSSDITRPGYPSPAPLNGSSPISFILMDDPEHARLRRMVTAPFTIKRVEAMRPAVQKIVDDLIDDLLAGPKPVDLVTAFALPVPSLVICELLGVPYADHDFFQENSKTIINREASTEQRAAALGHLGGYLHNLLDEKLANPGDDLLSGLTERIKTGELSQRDAAGIGVLLLIAGHETTANMIALGTLALLENPGQLALLRDTEDPKLVSSAVEELLRYLHITHNGRRRLALEDIELDGQIIRAGDGLIMANDIGNRDPDAFPDPDRLDIQRDARHHVAFGFGVHQCLGQPLARMELQVVYSTLYKRIPTLRLAADLEEIPFKHDGSVYGVYSLPVTW